MQIGAIHRWKGIQESTKLIFLHGFLGSGADFEIIADHFPNHPDLVAPDFPNYSIRPDANFTWDSCLKTLDAWIQAETENTPCILVGYSMGGRIALQYAIEHPQALAGLVLVGATPGMSELEARQKRVQSDLTLGNKVEEQSMEQFLESWFQQDVIQSQRNIPEPYLSRMYDRRTASNQTALAQALTSLGTGTMKPVWEALPNLQLPTLLVTGEQDKKFRDLARKMVQKIPQATHASIAESGHACCYEKPKAFVQFLTSFLSSLRDT